MWLLLYFSSERKKGRKKPSLNNPRLGHKNHRNLTREEETPLSLFLLICVYLPGRIIGRKEREKEEEKKECHTCTSTVTVTTAVALQAVESSLPPVALPRAPVPPCPLPQSCRRNHIPANPPSPPSTSFGLTLPIRRTTSSSSPFLCPLLLPKRMSFLPIKGLRFRLCPLTGASPSSI